MSFYSDVAAIPEELFIELGQVVTLTAISVGAYNPATGSAETTVTNQSVKAVALPRGIKDIDGTMIKQGDQKLLLSMVGTTAPTTDDTVTVGGKTYTITSVDLLSPAGVPVLCECNIRGA